ncbi:MAG: hypothetical protein IPO48_13400 [Saprospiraceae bacterium]|nr:hypothetical protein [Saprospiraceae bacterium]
MFAFNQISFAQCDLKCYSKKKFVNENKEIKLEKLAESNYSVSLFQTALAFDVDNDGLTEIITSSTIPNQNTNNFAK